MIIWYLLPGSKAVPNTRRFLPDMAHFTPPLIQQNDHGWGPVGIPEQFKDMPYQPFSKGDRLGKVRVSRRLARIGSMYNHTHTRQLTLATPSLNAKSHSLARPNFCVILVKTNHVGATVCYNL